VAPTADEQFDEFLWDIDLTARRPRAAPPAHARPVRDLPAEQPAKSHPAPSHPASDPHAHTHPRYRPAQPSAPAETPRHGRGRFFRPELEPGWRRVAANPYLQLSAGTLLASTTAYLVVVALTR
jgi:hypothetical protein